MSVILWRLLTRCRTAALATNHAHRLVTTFHVLRFPFAESIRIEELASIAAGPSASCRQFKALTPMTPLTGSEPTTLARGAPSRAANP